MSSIDHDAFPPLSRLPPPPPVSARASADDYWLGAGSSIRKPTGAGTTAPSIAAPDDESDTSRPPPPDPPSRDRIVALFLAGVIAQSVHRLRLRDLGVRQVDLLLRTNGFRRRIETIAAERTSEGAPQVRLRNGASTTDTTHPDCARVWAYAHEDGSLVHLYPEGDPIGRRAPQGKPTAIKAVSIFPARAWTDDEGRSCFDADTSLENVAIRVSDDGEVLPRDLRKASGIPVDADLRKSYEIALAVTKKAWLPLING